MNPNIDQHTLARWPVCFVRLGHNTKEGQAIHTGTRSRWKAGCLAFSQKDQVSMDAFTPGFTKVYQKNKSVLHLDVAHSLHKITHVGRNTCGQHTSNWLFGSHPSLQRYGDGNTDRNPTIGLMCFEHTWNACIFYLLMALPTVAIAPSVFDSPHPKDRETLSELTWKERKDSHEYKIKKKKNKGVCQGQGREASRFHVMSCIWIQTGGQHFCREVRVMSRAALEWRVGSMFGKGKGCDNMITTQAAVWFTWQPRRLKYTFYPYPPPPAPLLHHIIPFSQRKLAEQRKFWRKLQGPNKYIRCGPQKQKGKKSQEQAKGLGEKAHKCEKASRFCIWERKEDVAHCRNPICASDEAAEGGTQDKALK